MIKERILKLIESTRKNNTYKTKKGEWTIPDNQLTISISDLVNIVQVFSRIKRENINVAVVCESEFNFLDWKLHSGNFKNQEGDKKSTFERDKTVYKKVSDPTDLVSWRADYIIITNQGLNNPKFDEIMRILRYNVEK